MKKYKKCIMYYILCQTEGELILVKQKTIQGL